MPCHSAISYETLAAEASRPERVSLPMKSRSVVIFKFCFGRDFVYLGIGSVSTRL
jgi:hypothetical protein